MSLFASVQRELVQLATPPLPLDLIPPENRVVGNAVLSEILRINRERKNSAPTDAHCGTISAGKNSYVYDAHTYHTKVPPQGIRPLIEFYTEPNDIVLDPFCGSGMTGVAALECGRNVILGDLSPAATFIAYNFQTPLDSHAYMDAVRTLLEISAGDEFHLYATKCRECGRQVPAEYMVWSYRVACPDCNFEFLLWDVARDEKPSIKESKIKVEVSCPSCGKTHRKGRLKRSQLVPVQVGYKCCGSKQKERTATPDKADLGLLQAVEREGVPKDTWFPTTPLPLGINTRQAIGHGLDSVDKLYTTRNLWACAVLWRRAMCWPDTVVRHKLLFTLTSLYQRVTKLSEFRFWGGSGNTATYNVPMIMNEQNVFRTFFRKAKTIADFLGTAQFQKGARCFVDIQSAAKLDAIPSASIDYVFTDPPFGGNINYSEMNFLWEAWLQRFTDTRDEAIINKVQGKGLEEYEFLMTRSLAEAYRVLKPGHWLSLVFRSSSDEVWERVLNAIANAGFPVHGVQQFDKKHGTFKQFVSENTVGYDLVISCRKPEYRPHNGLRLSVDKFLSARGKAEIRKLRVSFLHVKRTDELDLRKLYSEWIEKCVRLGQGVECDFATFRQCVGDFLKRV